MTDKDLIKRRMSKTRFVGRMLARLPFVRCVVLNGSLASGKSKKSSDIDILIVAKTGRVFTCRFFVNVFGIIFRIKRPKDKFQICDNQSERSVVVKPHAGKFCFNYFLTENFLKIPTGRGEEIDKYCAENYSKSKFMAGDIRLFEKFMGANQKLFKRYDYHPSLLPSHPERSEGSLYKKILRFTQNDIKRSAEFFLCNRLEKILKNYQINLINKDIRTKKYPDLIVFNDKELRFHPPKLSSK